MTIRELADYLKVTFDELGDERLPLALVVDYIRQSLGTVQAIGMQYLYKSAYKAVHGEGSIVPYPTDSFDGAISEMAVLAGKGEAAIWSAAVTLSGHFFSFAGLEPKEMDWFVTFYENTYPPKVFINESNKSINIYYSTEATEAGINTSLGTVCNLLNADIVFREYFTPATTATPASNLKDGLGGVDYPMTGGEGKGLYRCYYLAPEEENSIINSTLLQPKLHLNMYYSVYNTGTNEKVIKILPDSVTHHRLSYFRRLDLLEINEQFTLPNEIKELVLLDGQIKCLTKLAGYQMVGESVKAYATKVGLLKEQYDDYAKQLSLTSIANSTSNKTV